MALSLGWHIILACFGMAFPAMIFAVHRKGLHGDDVALELAKRWSKVAGVLFAIGAVSGTILSFELGLLWPGLMGTYGDVVGLAFALEGISFFTEAIFLGIYVYGWGRIPGRAHILMLVPIMAAGLVGSFMVVSVNAWMNAPSGFRLDDGVPVDIDPVAAILNSAAPLQFLHMYLAGVMVVGFSVTGVYAMGWLRGRHDRLHYLGLIVPLAFVAIATPLQPVVGHFAGQRLADEQPIKLAAMEGLARTTDGATARTRWLLERRRAGRRYRGTDRRAAVIHRGERLRCHGGRPRRRSRRRSATGRRRPHRIPAHGGHRHRTGRCRRMVRVPMVPAT